MVTETLPLPVLKGTDALVDTEIAMLPYRHRDETRLALRLKAHARFHVSALPTSRRGRNVWLR